MLKKNGVDWHQYPVPKRGVLSVNCEDYNSAKQLIQSTYLDKNNSVWGWKDPRTALFLDFWKEILPNAKYIFVFRPPDQVASSLLRRGDLRKWYNRNNKVCLANIALKMWSFYNKKIVNFVYGSYDSALIIKVPDDIQDKSQSASSALTQLLNLDYNIQINNVYDPKTLNRKVPRWINMVTYSKPAILGQLRRLNSIHDNLIRYHAGEKY